MDIGTCAVIPTEKARQKSFAVLAERDHLQQSPTLEQSPWASEGIVAPPMRLYPDGSSRV
jgi:hypothetical protein